MLTGEDKSELFFFSLSSLIDQYNVSLSTVQNEWTNGEMKQFILTQWTKKIIHLESIRSTTIIFIWIDFFLSSQIDHNLKSEIEKVRERYRE